MPASFFQGEILTLWVGKRTILAVRRGTKSRRFERCHRIISGSYKEGLMTVISTIITKRFTAHASDSLITPYEESDMDVNWKKNREWRKPKIVPVKHWRGAMSYWGLAKTTAGWNTLDWLRESVRNAPQFKNPQEFAEALKRDLNREFRNIQLRKSNQAGLGIHLSVYEQVNDYWIPEMFKISNWTDNFYNAVHSDGFKLERVTYHTSFKPSIKESPEDGEPDRRMELHQKLQEGMILIYNNGDPVLFNPPAGALFQMFQTLISRGMQDDPNTSKAICALARRPIEVVAEAQRDFCRKRAVRVGGIIHDLAISPNGRYWSSTGDDKF
jgi:hypothetical protein